MRRSRGEHQLAIPLRFLGLALGKEGFQLLARPLQPAVAIREADGIDARFDRTCRSSR